MNNKQIKAAHNKSNQAQFKQQIDNITQGSDGDIGIGEIVLRMNGSTRTDKQYRSQPDSINRSTNSKYENENADARRQSSIRRGVYEVKVLV